MTTGADRALVAGRVDQLTLRVPAMTIWFRRGVVIATAAAVLLCGRQLRAQTQVSDQFRRVSKELAKRFVTDELTKSCKREDKAGNETTDPICLSLVESMSQAFADGIDGKISGAQVAKALRDEFTKVTQAAAVDVASRELERVLASMPTGGGACSLKGLASPVTECLIATVYQNQPKAVCDRSRDAAIAAATRCGVTATANTSTLDEILHRLAHQLAAKQDAYGAAVILEQMAQVAHNSNGTFYGTAQEVAAANDRLLQDWSEPRRLTLFGSPEIDAVTRAAKNSQCPGAAQASARVQKWKDDRERVFSAISRAISRFQSLPPEASLLPTDIVDPKCASNTDPLAVAVDRLRSHARVARFDATLSSLLQRATLPALTVGLLVDYVSNADESLLLQNTRDLGLQVLARVIAADDAQNREIACMYDERTPPFVITCQVRSTLATYTVEADKVWPQATTEERQRWLSGLASVIQQKRTPQSARHSCVYEAVSMLLTGSYPTALQSAPQLCTVPIDAARPDQPIATLLDRTIFGANLHQVAPGLMQWTSDQVLPQVVATRASLKFASSLGVQSGYSLLAELLSTSNGVVAEARVVELAAKSLQTATDDQARRVLLQAAISTFKPYITQFLDLHVAPLEWCQQGDNDTGIFCAVRVLADAAFEPLMDYLATPSGQADEGRLARNVYKALDDLDPLGRTPLLFNIGPGVTFLTRFDGAATTHFTLLDKFGIAARWGRRNQWEVGAFAGGFVDAIIRTAAEGTKSNPYWLLGGTFGLRKFTRDSPFGIELQVAAALPFDTSNFKDKVAAAGGLNLIIPAELAFEGND